MSHPLYVIQGEVTTSNINKNKSISVIQIPNKTNQIKISQYAERFLSVTNVLRFFENLGKAIGTTINLEKKTILPINTNDTSQI